MCLFVVVSADLADAIERMNELLAADERRAAVEYGVTSLFCILANTARYWLHHLRRRKSV